MYDDKQFENYEQLVIYLRDQELTEEEIREVLTDMKVDEQTIQELLTESNG